MKISFDLIKNIRLDSKTQQKKLNENERSMSQTVQQRREREIEKQHAQDRVQESEQRLRQTNDHLQQYSKQILDKQQAYNEQNARYNQLDQQRQQNQAARDRLESQIDEINSQWLSKQMWISNATNDLTELHRDVDHIKQKSRMIAQDKYIREQNLQNKVTNYRREEQYVQRRS